MESGLNTETDPHSLQERKKGWKRAHLFYLSSLVGTILQVCVCVCVCVCVLHL